MTMIRTLLPLALLVLACGDKDDDTGITAEADTDTDTDTDPQPGTLTVTSAEISGHTDNILLAFVMEEDGPAAAACMPITSDPEVVSGTMMTFGDENPCEALETVQFDAGDHEVSGGIYVAGQTVPEECFPQVTVTIDGDTEVTLGALEPCE